MAKPKPSLVADSPQPKAPESLPPGATWREVLTAGHPIGFILLRSQRRSIGLQITDDGLRVTAPRGIGLRQIDAAVHSKAAWIIKKLHLYQTQKIHQEQAQTQWCHDGTIPYLGRYITLSLDSELDAPWRLLSDTQSTRPKEILKLRLPATASHDQVHKLVNIWLQEQAKNWFQHRLHDFHKRFNLGPKHWRISAAKTRWGSCSSTGTIMLNWRLIHYEPATIDYVIAHELAHLTFMDHSRLFWQEVQRLCPWFQEARGRLRNQNPTSLPLL